MFSLSGPIKSEDFALKENSVICCCSLRRLVAAAEAHLGRGATEGYERSDAQETTTPGEWVGRHHHKPTDTPTPHHSTTRKTRASSLHDRSRAEGTAANG